MKHKERHATGLEIAIIGMTGRYPGARDVDQLWNLLRDGVEPVTRFSDAEILADGGTPAQLAHPDFVRMGFVVDDIDLFDASFFGYTPREAEIICPQQRLFLECASEALERAGYDPEAYAGRIGVFAGSAFSTYLLHNVLANPDALRQFGSVQIALATDKDYVATRVAYKLNLQGPAVTVQNACSTSLVAVHAACQSLLAGDCDIALAGGVSITSRQKTGYVYQDGGIASRDGHCRPFDASASGTVGSGGAGVVVLKRLADALEEGDSIDAVILGSAINNDGSRKMGFTAPSVDGQARVIQAAQQMAGIGPDDVGYVETHGTGTQLGDPIEIAALTRAFRAGTDRKRYCPIGSIKSNLGHVDAAAGVAGLTKAALALKHRAIPASLNFERPNPKIDFDDSPFYVSTGLCEWATDAAPRRAGVSSFGLGGTNAHVILEEAPLPPASETRPGPQLIVLSARTPTALDVATRRLAAHLREHPGLTLPDVAYTLQAGRRMFEHRRMLVCHDIADAARALQSCDPVRVCGGAGEPSDHGVVFMFSGQGAQYPGMTQGLYRDHDVFREAIDRCCELLKPRLDLDLRTLLYPADVGSDSAATGLKQTAVAQPALFSVEYALAQLWLSWGVKPAAMIGHSIGEYVAACIAGVFSLDDALALVAARARLMQSQASGAMLSVALARAQLEPLLGPLELAAVNAPGLCVASGPDDGIAALEQRLTAAGHACRRLHTSHAFHSSMMEPMLAEFERELAHVRMNPPRIRYVSNLTGTWITAEQAVDPRYWSRHLRHTVQFAAGVQTVLQDESAALIEVGPGNTLCSLVKQHTACRPDRLVLPSVRHAQQREDDGEFILNALGKLWLSGKRLAWPMLHAGRKPRRVRLPTYPFERQRYWMAPTKAVAAAAAEPARAAPEGEKRDIASWFHVRSWRRQPAPMAFTAAAMAPCDWLVFADVDGLGDRAAARLQDLGHRVAVVYPGSAFAQEAGERYTLAAAEPSHYEKVLRALRDAGRFPTRILHLWAVGQSKGGNGHGSDETPLDRCFFSLVHTAQALGAIGRTEPLELVIVSDGVHAVTGDEKIMPEKAVLLGPCNVMPREYPNIACRSIDIGHGGFAAETDFIDTLMAELGSSTEDTIVAYRGGYRWTPHMEPLPLPADRLGPSLLRREGVYLITGGLGGIGLALAEHLAASVAARLILVGRTPLPEKGQWDAWLASHPDDDATSRRLRALRALEARGAIVMTAHADISNETQMRKVVDQARARFGAIHGVVHAAGNAGGGLIQLKTRQEAMRVLAPKVDGTRVLEQLFSDSPLDFLVLCSSLAALTGDPGQVDYTAANAYLDAFAHPQHAAARQTISINWDAWRDVGMAVDTEVPEALAEQRRRHLHNAIRSDEGVQAFDRLLRCRLTQVAVSPRIAPSHGAPLQTTAAPEEAGRKTAAETSHARPRALAQPYLAPRNEREERIAGVWQELFGIDRVGVHDGFFDLGGHSLLALQVIARLRERLDIELSLAKFLELGTVEKLALHVDALSWAVPTGAPDAAAVAADRDEISL